MTLKARLERLEQKQAAQVAIPYLVIIRNVGEGEPVEPEPQGENVITIDSLGPGDWVNACNARDITGLT